MSDPDRPLSPLERWSLGAMRHARLVVGVAAVLVAASLVAAARTITFDADRTAMIDAEVPFRVDHERYVEEFPRLEDELVVVVDAPTPERARSVALDLARRLRGEEGRFHRVEVPRAWSVLEDNALLYLPEEEYDALAERLVRVQPLLGRLARDPSLRGLLELLAEAVQRDGTGPELERALQAVARTVEASAEGRARELSWRSLLAPERAGEGRELVLAQPRVVYDRILPAGPAMRSIRAHAEDAVAAAPVEGVRVRVTGGLALSHEELKSVLLGSGLIGAMVLLSVAVVLTLGLRSKRLVLVSLATLLAGLALTTAFAGLTIGHLNMVSVAFGILYLGLGVDYAIHLGLRYGELCAAGADRESAVARAVRDVGGSLVICALTTAIGFLAFVPTAYRGVSELGLISAAGMFLSLAATLTLMPALLALVPGRVGRGGGRRLVALGRLPLARPRAVLVVALVLGVGALGLVPRVGFDRDPLSLRDQDTESVEAYRDLLASSETPPLHLVSLAPSLPAARERAVALAARPEIARAVSLASFVPEDQERRLGRLEDLALTLGLELALDPAFREPAPTNAERRASLERATEAMDPDAGGAEGRLARALADWRARRGTAEDLEALERDLLVHLPESLERLRANLSSDGVEPEDLPEALAARWRSPSGVHRVAAYPERDLNEFEAVRALVESAQRVDPDVTGPPVMILESGDAVVGAFRRALAIAGVACAVVLLVLLRRARDAALVLGPLTLAALATVGALALLGLEFNFANIIGLPLLLGLGLDNGIHIVHRARERGVNAVLASSTGRGVLLSSATTFVSFANLSISPHRGTASLGWLLTLGIVASLLATLVVLPAALRLQGQSEE